jgi:hypothetical protein
MATGAANYAATQGPANSTTSYGAGVHSQILVRPQSDGVFGADLGHGLLLGCYTVHHLDTYTLDSGISQDAGQHNWGPASAGRGASVGPYARGSGRRGEPRGRSCTDPNRLLPSALTDMGQPEPGPAAVPSGSNRTEDTMDNGCRVALEGPSSPLANTSH